MRTIIHQFKYQEGIYLKHILVDLMLTTFKNTDLPQVLVPVPMHSISLNNRGYNQSWILAQQLAKNLRIHCSNKVLTKIHFSQQQAKLSAQDRRENLTDHFKVTTNAYHHITIIDDVYTTGSTLKTIANLLKLNGVKTVHAWCLARTA